MRLVNLVLLRDDDFVGKATVRLAGRRLAQVRDVHRAAAGDEVTVGHLGGLLGRGRVTRLDDSALEMDVQLDTRPPPKLPLTLLLALPRPKVLNRTVAAAASLGVELIVLLNAWKVEKSYWGSTRLSDENLLAQRIAGLEQARDTVLPEIRKARLFRPFVEEELPALLPGATALVAEPGAPVLGPRANLGRCVLAIGPEGGWIPAELDSLRRVGFEVVGLGPRILRVETALAALVGRLY
jgi:16S rRNA (uracil1498-N3)-methyltransferase